MCPAATASLNCDFAANGSDLAISVTSAGVTGSKPPIREAPLTVTFAPGAARYVIGSSAVPER